MLLNLRFRVCFLSGTLVQCCPAFGSLQDISFSALSQKACLFTMIHLRVSTLVWFYVIPNPKVLTLLLQFFSLWSETRQRFHIEALYFVDFFSFFFSGLSSTETDLSSLQHQIVTSCHFLQFFFVLEMAMQTVRESLLSAPEIPWSNGFGSF